MRSQINFAPGGSMDGVKQVRVRVRVRLGFGFALYNAASMPRRDAP